MVSDLQNFWGGGAKIFALGKGVKHAKTLTILSVTSQYLCNVE